MWTKVSHLILQNRRVFLIGVLAYSLFMGYQASRIELSYAIARILPSNDPTEQAYMYFRSRFGDDGNVMVIGLKEDSLFQLKHFNSWYDLTEKIRKIDGIKHVLSLSNLYNLHRNDSLKRLDLQSAVPNRPKNQTELDSLKRTLLALPFYEGLVYDPKTGATLMAITFDQQNLNSKERIATVKKIKAAAQEFTLANRSEMHFSGMPYIRTEMMEKVAREMKLFSGLAVLVTGLILYAFFRTFRAVWLSLAVVALGVLSALGTLSLLDYKITMLSGLIPALLIVIGIPNCIFLLNKYQTELKAHNNQKQALQEMIRRIGLSTFLANITTAIGFGVFYFTNSSLLAEFGVVAALNVMVTYLLCLILIPILLSYMPLPSLKHTRHLESKRITKLLALTDYLVHAHRPAIYGIMALLVAVSAIGFTQIRIEGFVVDDLPKKDPVYEDLRFFERNFGGVLPFEVAIDTKQPGRVFGENGRTLLKIRTLQRVMAEYPEFSRPLSVVEGISFLYQGFRGGDPKYYLLPPAPELRKLATYTESAQGKEQHLNSFLDSSRQVTRVSFQMADIGSERIKALTAELQPRIDSIFPPEQYHVQLTGHSLVFLKSNDYLLANLYESLAIAIGLIAVVGMVLFRSVAIIVLSKLPSLIPLLLTAGIMGFLDIPFKPSTILIFSIAFGIASDGTVYFLAKYRQELNRNRTVSQAVSITIRETGISMVYTAVILFFGFGIFAASSFGGTASLGIMTSITLLVAMATNLLLLPALLLSLDNKKNKRSAVRALAHN